MVGPDLSFGDHVAAVEERKCLFQKVFLRVEHADAERCEEFVEGEGQVVHVEGMHVDAATRRELRGVDEQQ